MALCKLMEIFPGSAVAAPTGSEALHPTVGRIY